tara:strand:+ start:801 stop:941 length:141 start_codon:yes stop_codon:yes gene_type:complete
MKKEYLIFLMVLIPLIGWLFNVYALFLFLPLGFLWKTKNKNHKNKF